MSATVSELLDIKGNEVVSIKTTATALEALELMADKNVGCVLVMTKDGAVSGICSERDLFRKVMLAGKAADKVQVRQIMTPKKSLVTILPTSTLQRCMEQMTRKRVRHLPVMTRGGKLQGVISIGDVVKALSSQKDLMIKQLEQYIGSSL
jgi:CBS domain-containing protein